MSKIVIAVSQTLISMLAGIGIWFVAVSSGWVSQIVFGG